MFWRFGFHNGSAIDSLLDKEDVALETILDEDELLQECKAQNTRLISHFERVDVLHKLLGYVTGQIESEEKGRFKYPYIATEVLCSEIWSIVETCVEKQQELLVPFWETVLDRSPEDMKTQMTMASHFSKINSMFMTKKPVEMLSFLQSQPSIVDKLLKHIETPPFVDLLGRIIQLDEHIVNSNVVEWLSSENFVGRLVDLLSPHHTPSIHTVTTDLIKTIISMATPSPGAGMTDGLQAGPASNLFVREFASRENVSKLADYMLTEFSEATCKTPTDRDLNEEGDGSLHHPTFESYTSSAVQTIAVVIELIRKNNSDYFEPYLFHTLRNRLIQVQQQSQLQGEEIRNALEQVMKDMVHRMGVVHLGPLLDVLSGRLGEFQKYLKSPRSLTGPISTTIGTMTPFTLERYRIVELYAELLHCSNMSLLNRPSNFSHLYDKEGRLQGGLAGLEELAQVIAQNSQEQENEPMDEPMDDVAPALDFPVRNPSDDSTLDSDDDMTDSDHEPNSSDDEAMEEIAMYDEPRSIEVVPIPTLEALQPNLSSSSSPILSPGSQDERTSRDVSIGSSPDSSSGTASRSSVRSRGSRRSSRSRKATALEASTDALLPVGEQLKRRFLHEKVIENMIDIFFQFPWNNFLHSAVYDIVHQVMTGNVENGRNRELIVSLFRDAKILHRIIEGQAANDLECSKPKGIRLGYMGHLMLIAEDVITAMARFPPELRLNIIQYAPEPQWDQYVTGRYNETKKEDSMLLGGGKPVVNASAARSISQWKVDEDDMGTNGPSTLGGGSSQTEMRGEFKRAASVGPPVRSTADFGPTNVEDDDDHNITAGRAPHFARYLAQGISSPEHFGSSSDEDDDDTGWLSQSTFNLGNTSLASRSLTERRPLSSGGFDDTFDPTDATALAMSSDPFSPHDDDGFGPFTDTNSSVADSFNFATFSDEESSFESFGDFGDFQTAEDGELTPTTPTTGSWTFASEAGAEGLSGSGLMGDFGGGSSSSSSGSTNGVGAGQQDMFSNPASSSSSAPGTASMKGDARERF